MFLLLGIILSLLVGCKRIEQPEILAEVTQSENKQTPSASSSSYDKDSKMEQVHDLKAEEQFVQQFLEAYTNYSSINEQKKAIQPYLTKEMKKKLAVTQLIPPDLEHVSSRGEQISIWYSEKEEWLGLVKVKINEQISSINVFVIGIEEQERGYLVNQFQSPTQD